MSTKTDTTPSPMHQAAPERFAFHPLLATLPVLDQVVQRLAKDAKAAKGGQFADKQELHQDNAETWAAFVGDIKERGIVKPIVCIKGEGSGLLIIDGRHRFNAAQEAGLKKIPYEIYEGDAASYIMGSVCHRYHWSKGQRAFFALHLHPELVDGAQGKRSDMAEPSEEIGKFASRSDLAKSIGVSADTVDIAARVHALFRKDKSTAKKYLPLIFAGVSLSGILSGDAASKSSAGAGGGQRKDAWTRLRLKWEKDSKAVNEDWAEVEQAGPEQQAEVKEALTAYVLSLPAALQEHLSNHFAD